MKEKMRSTVALPTRSIAVRAADVLLLLRFPVMVPLDHGDT